MHNIQSTAYHPSHHIDAQSLIQHNIPLAPRTWFKTGGSARLYAEPYTAEEFQSLLLYAKTNNVSLFILGQGANILVSDAGFNGLVIHPKLHEITIVEETVERVFVRASAGCTMDELITWSLDNCILGLEEFSGIPGSVGGSVFINLHYYQFLLSHFLFAATLIHKETAEIITVTTEWFSFGYNNSRLMDNNYYLVDATFALKRCTTEERAYARGRSAEIIRHRQARYPKENTCGSFFRNFLPHEVTLKSNSTLMIYVAYYLDTLGIKGSLHVNGAQVSHQHANMIVHNGTATSNDIITLARQMQQMVQEKYHLVPHPECLLIGFEQYPLW